MTLTHHPPLGTGGIETLSLSHSGSLTKQECPEPARPIVPVPLFLLPKFCPWPLTLAREVDRRTLAYHMDKGWRSVRHMPLWSAPLCR